MSRKSKSRARKQLERTCPQCSFCKSLIVDFDMTFVPGSFIAHCRLHAGNEMVELIRSREDPESNADAIACAHCDDKVDLEGRIDYWYQTTNSLSIRN